MFGFDDEGIVFLTVTVSCVCFCKVFENYESILDIMDLVLDVKIDQLMNHLKFFMMIFLDD